MLVAVIDAFRMVVRVRVAVRMPVLMLVEVFMRMLRAVVFMFVRMRVFMPVRVFVIVLVVTLHFVFLLNMDDKILPSGPCVKLITRNLSRLQPSLLHFPEIS